LMSSLPIRVGWAFLRAVSIPVSPPGPALCADLPTEATE
jgi:hypothetical protein